MEKPMSGNDARLGKRRETRRIGKTTTGHPHEIGTGFSAIHFSEDMFGGDMDPLIMVDHFVMTEPTFEPHLHAGISAVTFIFEDAVGNFLNRDTLGNISRSSRAICIGSPRRAERFTTSVPIRRERARMRCRYSSTCRRD
jgi:hypothetical protein